MKGNLRIILYAVAAGLIFMLWQKWHIESEPEAPSTAQTQVTGQQNGDLPSIQNNNQLSDISSQAQATNTANQITVVTDLMTLKIDLEGASINSGTLHDYKVSAGSQQDFSLLHENDPGKMMYQSGFSRSESDDAKKMHNGLWHSDQNEYILGDKDEIEIPLTWKSDDGVVYSKTFIFKKNQYQFTVVQSVQNNSQKAWEGFAYNQIIFGESAAVSGLGHVATFTGGVISTPDDRYQKISLSDIETEASVQQATQEGWVAMMQHYFIGALVPAQNERSNFYTRYNAPLNNHIVGTHTDNQTVNAGDTLVFEPVSAYFGPKIAKNLDAVAPYLDKTIDYGYLFMISQFMFKVMSFIHQFLGNWGWSIIIMTLLIKMIFFVPSAWAYKSMAKMRSLQPEMQAIRERFAGDRAQVSQEVMKLYRKEKVNPASGCLPMLLQIPFFIAFYWVLAESVQLRQAPWILWVQDLSSMDPLYILPIVNAALMFLQQRLNPPPPDPMQAKIMMMLPLVFGFMFMWFPSGLVLYWTVSNGFSIAQQYVMNKKYGTVARPHNHKNRKKARA